MADKAIATYAHKGEVISYTNNSDTAIEAGEIVKLGYLCGVAGADIAPHATGAMHIEGVFVMPKAKETDIKLGDRLCLKDGKVGKHVDGDSPCGIAVADTGTTVETVLVKINV